MGPVGPGGEQHARSSEAGTVCLLTGNRCVAGPAPVRQLRHPGHIARGPYRPRPRGGPEARCALEILLLILAERELESTGNAAIFYKSERQRWSERLRHAPDVVTTDEALEDRAAAMAEAMYANEGAAAPASD